MHWDIEDVEELDKHSNGQREECSIQLTEQEQELNKYLKECWK